MQRTLGQSAAFRSTRSLTAKALRIFVESAALYSIVNLLYAVLYAVSILEEAWFSSLVRQQLVASTDILMLLFVQDAPAASITFSLIIIRVESVVNAPTTRVVTTHKSSGDSEIESNDQGVMFQEKSRSTQPFRSLLGSEEGDLESGVESRVQTVHFVPPHDQTAELSEGAWSHVGTAPTSPDV